MDLQTVQERLQRLIPHRSKPVLGLQVESGECRAVALQLQEDESPRLIGFGKVSRDPWGAAPVQIAALGEELKGAFQGISTCSLVVEHPSLRIRRMSLAPMPERDLLEAIRWNFREHVDVPMEQYRVGYARLPKKYDEGKRMSIMAYGLSEEGVAAYQQLVQNMGMKTNSIEPTATALLSSLYINDMLEEERYRGLLALEETGTLFLIAAGEALLFSRPLVHGSLKEMREMIAQELRYDPQAIKTLFDQWMTGSLDDVPMRENIENAVSQYFHKLSIEVQRSIDAFSLLYHRDTIDQLFICGKGALIPSVASQAEHALGIPTALFDPFQGAVQSPGLELPARIEDRALFAAAFGAAVPM